MAGSHMRDTTASLDWADRFFGVPNRIWILCGTTMVWVKTTPVPGRSRIHADYSAQIKVYDKPEENAGQDRLHTHR